MKISIFLIVVFLLVLGCSKEEDLLPAELDKPRAMLVSCQRSSDDLSKRVDYKYLDGNLVTETTSYSGGIYSETIFHFNSDDQLILEVYEADRQKMEKIFTYNEVGQMIKIKYKFIDYDDNGKIISESEAEAPREYENNLLVKEWEYWGGFNTYQYKNGRLNTKTYHSKIGEEHHITTYKYSGNLLIEEESKTKAGGLLFSKRYSYDAQKRLIEKLKMGKTLSRKTFTKVTG